MRFYTKQHQLYCGIDLHARTMYACILDQHGEIRLHRNMQASPEMLLKAIAPSRDDIVIAVECIFTRSWLAARGADAGLPWVRGHALSLQAIHEGKATNDQRDAHKMAGVRRGGWLPHAL